MQNKKKKPITRIYPHEYFVARSVTDFFYFFEQGEQAFTSLYLIEEKNLNVLPDLNTLFRIQPHAIPCLNAISLVEVIKVRQDNVCPQLRWCMDINLR